MIRAIFWKEWHEHRSKYLIYWFAIYAPLLVLTLAIALSSGARVPFADLSDALALKYLPLSLIQSLLTVTIFLIVTGYLAVATFSPEIEDHSLFFLYEQPVSRQRYFALKLLHGACHVVLATSSAILLFPVVAYVMMLLSGRINSSVSGPAFALVMAAAARSAVWCSLISLAGFTLSALISTLVPRWWLAAGCSVLLTILLIYKGGDFFAFFPDVDADSISVGMSMSTGNSQWVTISRALKPAEVVGYAAWRTAPLLTAFLVAAACSVAIAFLYNRKELK